MNSSTTSQAGNVHAADARRPANPEAAAAALASAMADNKAVASGVEVAAHSDAVATALARMQTSRARLRGALLPKSNKPVDDGEPRAGGAGIKVPDIFKMVWRNVRSQFRSSPSVQEAFQTLQNWWKRQPWEGTFSLVGGELRDVMVPVVRRHPWATVGGAAAIGAAVVLAKPWRWSIVNKQWETLSAEALGSIRNQLFHVPLQMLLASLASLLVMQATTDDEPAAAAPAQSPDGTRPAQPAGAAR